MKTFFDNPTVRNVLRGALAGLFSAMAVDYHAFRTWKSLDEAKKYDWGTALLRWAQGTLAGALSTAGLGFLV